MQLNPMFPILLILGVATCATLFPSSIPLVGMFATSSILFLTISKY